MSSVKKGLTEQAITSLSLAINNVFIEASTRGRAVEMNLDVIDISVLYPAVDLNSSTRNEIGSFK
jgi:hypothetical protein